MKRKKIIILAVIVALAAGLALATLLNRPAEPIYVSPSASPTSDSFSRDRTLLQGLSEEFGAKFFTYQKPNDPAYFDSIRPYMTPEFFAENKRLTDRETVALDRSTPIKSTVTSAEVTEIDGRTARVRVVLTTEASNRQRNQTIVLNWMRQDDRWAVTSVQIEGTSAAEET